MIKLVTAKRKDTYDQAWRGFGIGTWLVCGFGAALTCQWWMAGLSAAVVAYLGYRVWLEARRAEHIDLIGLRVEVDGREVYAWGTEAPEKP